MELLWHLSRHYILHLVVSICVYFALLQVGFHLQLSYWLLGTYLPDIDHLINWFAPHDKTAKAVLQQLQRNDIPLTKKAKYAVDAYWKDSMKYLLIHNFVAFYFLILLAGITFFMALPISALFISIIVHSCVDICGDIIRWRHVDNWLWKENSTQTKMTPALLPTS